MDEALFLHRLHFAFTITFHYLFPQLTMGLAPLIVILKTMALRSKDPRAAEQHNNAARFWARIFGVCFTFGVVTGIPMEFQFGTNWSRFARLSGGVIGQPLAMEGAFSFFLESAFLGTFLYGEKRLRPIGHWWAAFLVFAGSWLSGFFIVATDAWMQHPVAFTRMDDGSFNVNSFWGFFTNPWLWVQYAHTMSGALITGSFVMAAVGAYYLLSDQFTEFGRTSVRIGVIAALVASVVQIFPTGDIHGRLMAQYQPVTTAGMEGLFRSQTGAPLVILGQPDTENERIENPLVVNGLLSFLIYGTTAAEVKGLSDYPRDVWPSSIPLLYFAYHIMAGLGTVFAAVAFLAAVLLYRKRLFETKAMLWILMLCLPLPFIANTAGWVAAETGRQPWLIYGLLRTSQGYSNTVHAGSTLFTLLGFMGLYLALGILFVFLVWREIEHGPTMAAPVELPPRASLTNV